MVRVLGFAIAILVPGAELTKNVQHNSEQQGVQGTWLVERLEFRGVEVLPQNLQQVKKPKITMSIKGDRATCKFGPETPKKYTWAFRLDPCKSPKAVDLIKNKKIIRGIYDLDRRNLRVCLPMFMGDPKWYPDHPRPTRFETERQFTIILFCKRIKP